MSEKIPDIIRPMSSSPFIVKEDAEMQKLRESIKQFGLLSPIVIRQIPDKNKTIYEIVCGNRRFQILKELQYRTIPVMIASLSDDDAMIAMIDSNLCHREHILPSEKAFGYKMKLEAMNRQGYRTDISTLSQVGTKLNTAEELSQNSDDSRTQIYRYIRLTNLIHELLDMVDVGRIAFTPAVELSYLTENEQRDLLTTIESEECTPSLAQAQQMRSLSENNELDIDRILSIMTKPKANQKEYLKIPAERINQYFDERVTNKQREEIIIKALDHYSRYIKRNKDRGAR